MPTPFEIWYAQLIAHLETAPQKTMFIATVLDGEEVGITYKLCCAGCADQMLRETFRDIFGNDGLFANPEDNHLEPKQAIN